jgi:AraC-like DNA-binding protein
MRLSDIAVQGELAGLLDRVARAGDLTDPAQGRAALGRVILISALLEREKHREDTDQPTAASKLAARYARAVEDNLTSGASIETLAYGLGVTPAHLTRTVKSTCGMSALDYRNARLMHEARRRLVETDDTAATIGASLGFTSPAYFSRAFTASAGQPPSRFRRAARQVALR